MGFMYVAYKFGLMSLPQVLIMTTLPVGIQSLMSTLDWRNVVFALLMFPVVYLIYLPFFKLCPELKFSFGLVDLLEKDRGDLTDPELIKYPNSLSKATSRMVTLTFNFE